MAEHRHVCIAKVPSRDVAASAAPHPITVGPARPQGSGMRQKEPGTACLLSCSFQSPTTSPTWSSHSGLCFTILMLSPPPQQPQGSRALGGVSAVFTQCEGEGVGVLCVAPGPDVS